jgi:hypothetical protein
MKFIFRVHTHTQIEIDAWKKIGFTSIKENNFLEYGVISATANLNGFTPLNAILGAIGIRSEKFKEVVDALNAVDKIYHYTHTKPNLIFVPLAKGESSSRSGSEYYTTEIISICNLYKYKYLHFTHFGFINGIFQSNEISKILKIFLNPLVNIKLETIYFEIDSRHLENLKSLFNDIANRIFRLGIKNVEVIYAQEYEFIDTINLDNGMRWAEFKPKEN